MTPVQLKASLALWRSRYAYRYARLKLWPKNKAHVAKWEKLSAEAKKMIHLRIRQIKESKKPKPKPPHQITMWDSIEINLIPSNAEAVAGYTSGRWPTYASLVAKFPKAHHLSIAVSASHDADCLDVEQGDAEPTQAAAWVRKQHARGIQRPVVYTSLSGAANVISLLVKDSIPRSQVRLWTAHYSFKPHRCTSACGYGFTGEADATQWTDKALNRNLDQSLCKSDFFQ